MFCTHYRSSRFRSFLPFSTYRWGSRGSEAWRAPGSSERASGLTPCGRASAAPSGWLFIPGPDTLSPSPEWFASSTQSYILRDLDDTSVVEDGRKKLNTLAHYKVGSPVPASPHSQPIQPGL